ncbi:AAA domain-containing protein OS=Bosea thiooxidans OX=53254 GN=SAMN05660750_04086 PE=4 SV=1 [Bosea thiooxidans]|uniref:AAA domain-containing protein n=1 Tax=Bosea thiooxidans TaxID=53254 RepID=A0A1T5GID8_9HYPH|nr:AAA family ATPase [Bosea thiooxidans]SKC08145.1 AAA domain-containing protein [Bosea thiooxidans]
MTETAPDFDDDDRNSDTPYRPGPLIVCPEDGDPALAPFLDVLRAANTARAEAADLSAKAARDRRHTKTNWMFPPSNDNRRGGSVYPGIVSSADFVDGFVPPDYHLDGIAQAGFLYALTAGTGTGKTAVLLALTAATALGAPLCGRDVRKGRVVYFAGENPDDVRMRWLAMAHRLSFDPAEMDVHFIAGTFSIPAATARIGLDVERLGGADMIVVDTSAAYFQGEDENANTSLGKHARDLRALTELPGKPAVFVACHPTKSPDPANLQPRGGGAFIAEIDGNLVLSKENGMAKLHWQVKHRGADFAPLFFALESVTAPPLVDSKGRSVPTVMAIGMADWKPAEGKIAKAEAWEAALTILRQQGPMLESDWCDAYRAEHLGERADSVERRFRRYRAKLVGVGKVGLDGALFKVLDTDADASGHVQDNVQTQT